MNDSPTTIGARWICPVSRPPLPDAALVVHDGIIRQLIPGGRKHADRDAGEVALLPRLINAHTHLEFADLPAPIGQPGIAITDWIPQVVTARRNSSTKQRLQAIQQGIAECIASGTGAIGEIATTPWYSEIPTSFDCHITCFIERLGTDPASVEPRMSELAGWLDTAGMNPEGPGNLSQGISPHAPYSLNDRLLEQLIDCAGTRQLPLAMHLAESPEELQWLARGAGPMADMLESMGVLFQRPAGRRPLDYLQRLASAPRTLIVHGNYLQPDELDCMAGLHDRMHLVYCPRTHAFFEHARWPLEQVLERGINVALGTDSRASSPDLNMWSELQMLARKFPGISRHRILEMGTLGGARALGLDHRLGTLEAGRQALFFAIPTMAAGDDPLESLSDDP